MLTFFSAFCSIFSLISLDKNNTPTAQGCWTYGTSDTSLLYFGISGFYARVTTGQFTVASYIDYATTDCDQNSSYCSSCDTAGGTICFLVFLACATRISSVMLLKARMNPLSDIAVIKSLGIFSEALAAMCLAGALFVWQQYCHNKLPLNNLVYSAGPGGILCALALGITIVLVIVHVMIPTINPRDAEDGCCSSRIKEPQNGSLKNRKKAEKALNNPEAKYTEKMEMTERKKEGSTQKKNYTQKDNNFSSGYSSQARGQKADDGRRPERDHVGRTRK